MQRKDYYYCFVYSKGTRERERERGRETCFLPVGKPFPDKMPFVVSRWQERHFSLFFPSLRSSFRLHFFFLSLAVIIFPLAGFFLPENGALVNNVPGDSLRDLDLVGLVVEVPLERAALGLGDLHGLQATHAAVFLEPERIKILLETLL